MQNSDFFPQYTFRGLWDVLLISFGLLFMSVFVWWKQGFGLVVLTNLILLVLFCYWWMHVLIRRIVFLRSAFSVTRLMSPSKTIDYTDVTDIGLSKIKTRRGDINLGGMSNVVELINRFGDLVEQGKIDQDQIAMRVVVEDIISEKSTLPALAISLPFWVLIYIFWPYNHYWFAPFGIGGSCGLVFFVADSIVRRILNERLKNARLG